MTTSLFDLRVDAIKYTDFTKLFLTCSKKSKVSWNQGRPVRHLTPHAAVRVPEMLGTMQSSRQLRHQ